MNMEEIWVPIPNYEDKYLISSFGRVKSLRKNIIMKPDITKDGYFSVCLQNRGNNKHRLVDRLVAECFIPLPDSENEYEVDHIDNNRQNNNISNLKWVTHKENLEKSFQRGAQSKPKRTVYQYNLSGDLVAIYESRNEAFRKTGIRHISECCLKKKYYNTAGGFIWRYEKLSKEEILNGA